MKLGLVCISEQLKSINKDYQTLSKTRPEIHFPEPSEIRLAKSATQIFKKFAQGGRVDFGDPRKIEHCSKKAPWSISLP